MAEARDVRLLRADDLARWQPTVETPVGVDFADHYEVFKTGAWGQGPVLLQQLRLLEALMSATPRGVTFVYVRQPEPLGLGHAVLCAQPVVGDEPFAVILADDLIDATPGVTGQLVESYQRHGASVLAVQDVPRQDTSKYGIVATEPMDAPEERVVRIVEKPRPEEAPSTLAVVGRYVLRPEIFAELATTQRGSGGEIQLTDAIARRVPQREVIVRRFTGTRFDCGSKQGFLAANMALGRKMGLVA